MIMKNYSEAKNELFKHVGFKEDWVVYPISDFTNYYWKTKGNKILYALKKKDVVNETGEHYEDEIYMQRFYDKWIYKGSELTMIFCDPKTDNTKWFKVFTNKKMVE